MGEQDDARASFAGGVGDQGVASAAGGGGQAAGGFGPGPCQAAPVGVGVSRRPFGEGGPAGAVRGQAVVDGEGQQASTALPRPVGGDMQQGDGVAAAGQGEGDGMARIRFQPGGQAGQNRPGPAVVGLAQPGRRAGVAAAAQPRRVRVSAARVRTAGLAASA